MAEIQLATVLPGAKAFKEGNVSETFRGQILLADGSVKSAVIKDLDQTELSNELLAAVLARDVGLPTPDAYLALVRGSDLAVSKAPRVDDGNHLVFASVDVKVPNITFRAKSSSQDEQRQLLRDILEWGGLGDLYAFDSWTANIDRHAGNLLFGGQNEIWLIDHGQCFSGPTWQPGDLDPNGEYRNRLSEWLTPHLTIDQKRRRSSEAVKFAAGVGSIDVPDSSKKSRIDTLIPATHVSALEAFLKNRTTNIPAHANRALGVPTLL